MKKESKEIKWKLPTGFTTIPPEVRYSKDISAGAKLLYGDIKGLSFERGFCSASNEYLAFCFDVDDKTISEWVNQLYLAGFIRRDIVKRTMRKLYPWVGKISVKKPTTLEVKDEKASVKADNSLAEKPDSINIIYNNISKDISSEEEFDSFKYFENTAKGKKKQQRIIAYFGIKKKKYVGLKSSKECNAFLYNPRLMSVAKRMEGFPDDAINKAFYAAENMTVNNQKVDWSLELVEKQLLK